MGWATLGHELRALNAMNNLAFGWYEQLIRIKIQSGHLIKNIYKTYDLILA